MSHVDEKNQVGQMEEIKLALTDLIRRLDCLEKVYKSPFFLILSIFYSNIRLVDLIIFLLPVDRM